MSTVWKSCYTCADYAKTRRHVIAEPLADKAQREGRDVVEVVNEFMAAAHARHMDDGSSLRPDGPTRMTDPAVGRLAALLGMSMPPETDPIANASVPKESAS